MPSANHWHSLRRSLRQHPALIATSAATVGVLLGGFVAVQALAPVKPKLVPVQMAAHTKPAPAQTVGTTGAAPADEAAASTSCDKETWPYLSRECADQLRQKELSTRVVTTDKPPVNATGAQPAPQPSANAPASSPVVAAAPVAPQPESSTVVDSTAPVAPAPEPSQAFAKPDMPSSLLAPTAAKADEAPAAQAEMKKEKRVAKKVKPKIKPMVKPDDEEAVASVETDGRAIDQVSTRYGNRRPHIVARWTERVPDDEADDAPRRVFVHRGGLFENLFGMGRGGDDD
jgi:hypothetical protein